MAHEDVHVDVYIGKRLPVQAIAVEAERRMGEWTLKKVTFVTRFLQTVTWHLLNHHLVLVDALAPVIPPLARFKPPWRRNSGSRGGSPSSPLDRGEFPVQYLTGAMVRPPSLSLILDRLTQLRLVEHFSPRCTSLNLA